MGRRFGSATWMGGNAQADLDHNEDADALIGSDAAMLFVEWPHARSREGIHAAQVAIGELPAEHPAALVLTKCEGYLTPVEFARFALDPIGLGRERSDVPADLVDLFETMLEHFEQAAVFPISVYGWNSDRPAQFCDEFGRLVPWRIQPAQVDRPFEYILARLPRGVL